MKKSSTDQPVSLGFAQRTISLGDIAKVANVSRTTVSYALRDSPCITQRTRERIKKIARDMDYIPDARMAFRMDKVRNAKMRSAIPIAWLNLDSDKNIWDKRPYLKPYIEGARERCAECGYRLDEFWGKQPGMTMRRMSGILYNRGIQGIIIAPSNGMSVGHLRLEWQNFASVCFDKGVLAPRLCRVVQDYFYNITLVLKVLRRSGYRRIGVFLHQFVECRSLHSYTAGITLFNSVVPVAERIKPFIYRLESLASSEFIKWYEENRPDVIICQHSAIPDWLKAKGYRIPGDVGVAHLALDDDVMEWAGICQRKHEIGAETAEEVISMVQNHRLGIPSVPHDTLIQGYWSPGCTLLLPKPKSSL